MAATPTQQDCTQSPARTAPYVYDGCYWNYQTAAMSEDGTAINSYAVGGYVGDSLTQYNDSVTCDNGTAVYIGGYVNGQVTQANFIQVGLLFNTPGCGNPTTEAFAYSFTPWSGWQCDSGTHATFQGQACEGDATVAPFNMQGNNYYWVEMYTSGSQLIFYVNNQPVMQFSFSPVGITNVYLAGEEADSGPDNPDNIMYNSNYALDADFASVYYVNTGWTEYSDGWWDNWQIVGPKTYSIFGEAYCSPSGLTWGNRSGPNYARADTSYNNDPSSYIVFKNVGNCFQAGQKFG